MQGDVVLTREQIVQLRLEAGAAEGLRGPAAAERPGVHPRSAEDKLALALLPAEHAWFLAAARAAVAAAREGASDPLVHVEAELACHGGLPPQGASVLAVPADARTAMMLAGKPHEPVLAAA
jgi:hypothetical protein